MKALNLGNVRNALFCSKWRINGWMYLLCISTAYIVYFVFSTIITKILGTNNVWWLISFITIILLTAMLLIIIIINWIKRFHDIWKSGWNMFWLLIPLYNIIVSLNLLFKRWDKEKNKYWNKPEETSKSMKTTTIILFIVYCGIMFLWK